MTAPGTLFRPFARLIKISILGKEFEVPENNSLLRCMQISLRKMLPTGVSAGTKTANIAA